MAVGSRAPTLPLCDVHPLFCQPGNAFDDLLPEKYFVDVPHVEHVN